MEEEEERKCFYASKCREIGSEGIVLIKNDDNILPFTQDDIVTIFGRPQINYIRNGTGSGGCVKVDHSFNILEGFRNDEIKINEEVVKDYEEYINEHPYDNANGKWGCEPFFQADMPISVEYSQKQSKISNKALYIIGRTAGEDQDNFEGEGSYLLTKEEISNLKNITSSFEKVVVALNVTNVIDMQFINEPEFQGRIKAVLYLWCGGMEGGNSAADILSGKVTPSGKLTDTIPFQLADHPSHKNFGGKEKVLYKEDVYVGYRYFETFFPEKVMFEFGYGLSYTQFDVKTVFAEYSENRKVSLKVEVKNIGDKFNGKEVVQIYFSAPQGKLGKPIKQLVLFEKTNLLNPGESQTLSMEFDINQMASYDDSNITGNKSCYVLEEGEYKIYVGTSVKKVQLALTFSIKQLIVVERLSEVMCPNDDELQILTPGKKKENDAFELIYLPSQKPTVDLNDRIKKNLPKPIKIKGNKNISLSDVKQKKAKLTDFVAQLSVNQLAQIVRGESSRNVAGCFGGLSEELLKFGIPVATCADGPNGVHFNGPPTVQIPIGTSIASTWNKQLVTEVYNIIGNELKLNKINILLGPGINIHRSLLNGRNFEYFSEDPYLTGMMAISSTKGLRDAGVSGTIKHFALNNQEYYRRKVNSVCSERAIREIYLKAFEMSVKSGNVLSIMTSYNPVNGHWTASNYDLNTTILRGEWKFNGFVMTDWQACMNDVVDGGEGYLEKTRDMIRSQNDLYMIVFDGGAKTNILGDNTEESIENGTLTLGELQRSVINIFNFFLTEEVPNRSSDDDQKRCNIS